jgi:hypothetical protein
MSEALPPDDDEAMLARLAQLDLALAERVHAAAMAATEPDEINDLGRTYQRVARSLRQTLALKAKLRRDRAADLRADPPPAPPEPPPPKRDWVAMRRRQQTVGEAVHRVLADTFEMESDDYEMNLDVLRSAIDRTAWDPEFTVRPLDEHVMELCAILDLPLETAERWRDLPPAPPARREPDDDDEYEDDDPDDAVPAPTWRGSG